MNVMLADIEADCALGRRQKPAQCCGPDVRGVTCDVTDPGSVERAAEASYKAFGTGACGLQQCRGRGGRWH